MSGREHSDGSKILDLVREQTGKLTIEDLLKLDAMSQPASKGLKLFVAAPTITTPQSPSPHANDSNRATSAPPLPSPIESKDSARNPQPRRHHHSFDAADTAVSPTTATISTSKVRYFDTVSRQAMQEHDQAVLKKFQDMLNF